MGKGRKVSKAKNTVFTGVFSIEKDGDGVKKTIANVKFNNKSGDRYTQIIEFGVDESGVIITNKREQVLISLAAKQVAVAAENAEPAVAEAPAENAEPAIAEVPAEAPAENAEPAIAEVPAEAPAENQEPAIAEVPAEVLPENAEPAIEPDPAENEEPAVAEAPEIQEPAPKPTPRNRNRNRNKKVAMA